MKSFKYLVQVEEGIHARPTSAIVNIAKKFSSKIIIKKDEKEADCKRMFAIMALNAKKGDLLEVFVSGDDENQAVEELHIAFKENV